jgi:hypothetical protein
LESQLGEHGLEELPASPVSTPRASGSTCGEEQGPAADEVEEAAADEVEEAAADEVEETAVQDAASTEAAADNSLEPSAQASHEDPVDPGYPAGNPPIVEETPIPVQKIFSDAIGNACEYWRVMNKVIDEARSQGEEALKRSYVRGTPSRKSMDPFPWTGKFHTEHTLAIPDPDDHQLVESCSWLMEVAEDTRRKSGGSSPSVPARTHADCGEEYMKALQDEAMKQRTGKTQKEWEAFIYDLQDRKCPWDWSHVEVRQRRGSKSRRALGDDLGKAGVFAVSTAYLESPEKEKTIEERPRRRSSGSKTSTRSHTAVWTESLDGSLDGNSQLQEVVFEEGDVIGPLGGVLRRLSHYQEMYFSGHSRVLHDPACHLLSLRLQTADMKLDPLCIDMRAGDGQNRLLYLADARLDPLGLRALLQLDKDAGPRSVLPPRSRMPRPKSRPGSPDSSPYGRAQDTVPMPVTPMSMQAVVHDNAKAANVTAAEVLIEGRPYVFIVATRNIHHGEELTLDHGEEYWASQRAMLTRLLDIGRLGRESVVRVNRDEDLRTKSKEETSFGMPQRESNHMRRVKEEV